MPFRLRLGGKVWLILLALVLALWVALYASNVADPLVQKPDDAILRVVAELRVSFLVTLARGVEVLGSVWTILVVRWVTIAVLAFFRRWRHLVVFVSSVFALRPLAAIMATIFGRPRPTGIRILGTWQGYAHPSRPVAALAVALVGAGFALAPEGRWRRLALVGGALPIAALAVSRVYLAVDHPSDVGVAVVLGVAFAVIPFRVFCPERVFPVRYEGGRSAHVEIDAERARSILEAVREQLGIEGSSVEAVGLEESAGSTPLRIRRAGDEPDVFAKLYASSHLRADRWYKLARTILYGALEDEAAFNSTRQLVEYEDYMLRLMRDGGLPTPEPLGIVETEPEREYLIVTEYFERSEEADEAHIDEGIVDQGMEVIAAMRRAGLAHRDLKPGNVLIHRGELKLIDVAFAQIRPSRWRQAVDLANMMLLLGLGAEPSLVFERAAAAFGPDDVAEAFAATRSVTIPRGLRAALKEDGRDLEEVFRRMAPARDPIAIQRWSVRRVWLALRTGVVIAIVVGLLVVNLASLAAP